MAKVYALFVGINHYAQDRWTDLGGCVNDVEAARRWLEERLDTPPDTRVLTDRDATVGAVSTAITRHLGKAGPGDRAFLWFSGHGTEYDVRSRAEALIEATGKCQALVCADGPLPDKRLGALLDGIAARGAHVAAVLDCCFSGGATRDPSADPRAVARYAPPLPEWSTLPEDAPPPLPGAARDTAAPATGPRHVLLAACRLNQRAYERDYGGRTHGVFAHALLNALRTAPPGATYREVLAAAHARVQGDQRFQHPVIAPPEPGGIADTPVLGGAVRPPAPHLLRYGPDGWEVDCGGVHGLREGGGDDARGTAFAVTGDHGGPVVRARAVHPTRTLVTPDGWVPDRARAYPVTPSSLALPPLAVRLEGPDAQAVARALAGAGPGGGPSPLLRPADDDGPEGLRRVVTGGGLARVLRRDGSPAVDPLPLTGPADARRVARCLVHLARWQQLYALGNPASPLAGLVRVEVVPWGGYGVHDRSAVAPDATGELLCRYTGAPGRWRRPEVAIRIHNHANRSLWAVLIALTDSHAAHTELYPGDFIGARRTGHVFAGEPVELSLPRGRAEMPGAEARDWFKLVVAESEISTAPFHLPRWDPHDARDVTRGGEAGADGVLRLVPSGGTRDAGPSRRRGPGHWWATTIAVRTVVPPQDGRPA